MAGLSEIWETLEDYSWSLLDALGDNGIPIGDFFEENNIPATVFPIAIILLIGLLIFFLLPSGPSDEVICDNNKICSAAQGETSETCPADCAEPVRGKRVILTLDKNPSCELTFNLHVPGTDQPIKKQGRTKEYTYDGIEGDSVYFEITDQQGHSQITLTESIAEDEQTIKVTLQSDLCTTTGAGGNTGVIQITVRDSVSKLNLNAVSVSISEVINGRDGNFVHNSVIVNQQGRDLTVSQGKTYRVSAEKSGYEDYRNTVSVNRQVVPIAIEMVPLSSDPVMQKGST